MDTCKTCNGNGKIRETKRSFFGTVSVTRSCNVCNGAGKIPKEKCAECGGHGVLRRQEEIAVAIPFGIENGEMIRMTGKGEAIAGGMAGDLYIKVHVKRHSTLRREGSNLIMGLNLKLSEALLGGEHSIATLEGPLKIVIPEGVSFGEVLRVRNKGVPVGRGGRGDLLVKISISMPKKLSRDAKKILEELKKEGL